MELSVDINNITYTCCCCCGINIKNNNNYCEFLAAPCCIKCTNTNGNSLSCLLCCEYIYTSISKGEYKNNQVDMKFANFINSNGFYIIKHIRRCDICYCISYYESTLTKPFNEIYDKYMFINSIESQQNINKHLRNVLLSYQMGEQNLAPKIMEFV